MPALFLEGVYRMNIEKIYFDMDGVLADFARGVRELCGIDPPDQDNATKEQDDIMWKAIRDTGHFYSRLEPVEGAPDMYRELKSRYDVEILSAIPRERRGITTAREDKIEWAHNELDTDLVVNIVTSSEEKKNYAGPGCVLIDDLEKNITEWKACGGTGILFTSAEQILKETARIEQE